MGRPSGNGNSENTPAAKPRVSGKIPPGQAKKVDEAIDLIRDQWNDLALVWPSCPEWQRREYLERSPALARLLRLVEAFFSEGR